MIGCPLCENELSISTGKNSRWKEAAYCSNCDLFMGVSQNENEMDITHGNQRFSFSDFQRFKKLRMFQ